MFLKGHNADPRAPSLIGSMSKPITGVCIATLIRDGKLTFTTPLRERSRASSAATARRPIAAWRA